VKRRPLDPGRQRRRRVHADREDRQVGIDRAKGLDELGRASHRRLEDQRVDPDLRHRRVVHDRLVSERQDEVHKELLHLGVRFGDQDSSHGLILSALGSSSGVPFGMNPV
jgi:hypothetical protein